MTAPRVVVIGGGVSGLACAWTVQAEADRRRLPLSLTVLEAADHAGGHACTTEVDGFAVESGPNAFLSREPDTLALVDALGLRDRLVEASPRARQRFVVRGGRLCRVPSSPATFLTSSALSWRGKLRLLAEPWAVGPPPYEETVHQFASRRLGREAADVLVDAAVSGISAGDSRTLSMQAHFPKLVEMERTHGSLVRAMLSGVRSRGRRRGEPSRLLSFDRGMGVLAGAMADRLGPRLRTGQAVQRVERTDTTWRVRLETGEPLSADHVVMATPARVTARLLGTVDAKLCESLQGIAYAGLAVVAMGFRTRDIPRPLDGFGYLVTRAEEMATLGVLWESSIFPNRAPSGFSQLRVFLGGARQPDVVHSKDSRLAHIAREDLHRVMAVSRAPVHTWVYRWPEAIAQPTLGHVDRRSRIAEGFARHPGLHACGTSYDGVSFNHAVSSARATADALATAAWGAQTATAAGAGY